MPNRKANFSMKSAESALRAVEQGVEMLERGAKAANRVKGVVAQGKARGAKRAASKSNPMRGPGLSPLTASGAPVSVSYPQGPTYHTVTRSTPEVTSVRGRAFLGNVNSTGASYNIVGGTYSLNPVLLSDRLSVMATTFDKYVYKRVKICYVPFAATSQQGQVYLYLDRDYLDPLADPTQVGQIMAQYNAIADQPWKNMSTALVRDPTEKRTYFTLLNQAQLSETEQFRVVSYVTASSYTGIIGQLYLEYDLDLVGPNYAPTENYLGSPSLGNGALANFYSAPVAKVAAPSIGAGSHSVYAATGGSAIFGIPDTSSNRVWEVVLADVTSSTGYAPASCKWQSANGPAVTFTNGMTIYLVRVSYTGTGANVFNIFEFYQDAMAGDTSQSLWCTSATDISLLPLTATVLVRAVSNATIAANP